MIMRTFALKISYFEPQIDDRYMKTNRTNELAVEYILSHPERFKPTKYATYYAGDDGYLYRIKNNKAYKISGDNSKNNAGYKITSLQHNGKAHTVTVHTLICEAFHGPRPIVNGERYTVDHLNGKDDNRPEHLEWVTFKENMRRRAQRSKERIIKEYLESQSSI